MAQGRVRDLESVFHRSEAELAAALSDKRTLENDVAELRTQLAKVAAGGSGCGLPLHPHPCPVHTPGEFGDSGDPQGPYAAADSVTSCLSHVSRRRTGMRWLRSSWRRRR